MKILALEFSSPQRSVAVVQGDKPTPDPSQEGNSAMNREGKLPSLGGGGGGSVEIIEAAPGNTMKPLGMIESALKDAGVEREQIECLAVGLGPGSYNGIRVAIALAQGWQLASGVKLLGVSSAECVAAQAQSDGLAGRLAVVIDAQRGEFYLAGYELNADGWRETSPLRLTSRDEVQECERAGELLIGPEVLRWFPNGRVVFPRAAMLGQMAQGREDFASGEKLEPLYLREMQFVKAPRPRVVSS